MKKVQQRCYFRLGTYNYQGWLCNCKYKYFQNPFKCSNAMYL
uniref:Uncharacterized protein n=1 Tax=Anguilla anguilla TaxID=7936 RepID=A0A0E9WPC7_ANGAN